MEKKTEDDNDELWLVLGIREAAIKVQTFGQVHDYYTYLGRQGFTLCVALGVTGVCYNIGR